MANLVLLLMHLVALLTSVLVLVASLMYLFSTNSFLDGVPLLTNIGVYILVGLRLIKEARKLLEPTKTETDKSEKTDK